MIGLSNFVYYNFSLPEKENKQLKVAHFIINVHFLVSFD